MGAYTWYTWEKRDARAEALAALELLGQLIIPKIHRTAQSEPADAT